MIDSNFEKQYNAEAIRDTMAILMGNKLGMSNTKPSNYYKIVDLIMEEIQRQSQIEQIKV